MSEASGTGRPGRYQRSTGGLIGAILVLLLVVGGVVVFRGAFRTTPSYEPEHIDYLALVGEIQQSGVKPVYPASLPSGWYVKDRTFLPGDRPVLDLAMSTSDGLFVGLHQEDASIQELVERYVDADPTQGKDVSITSDVGSTWESFTDSGGDHAYAAEVGRISVLVYGSASPEELKTVVASLTTKPVKN